MNEKYKSQYHIVSQKEENEIEGLDTSTHGESGYNN